jgi:hypothetical protein
MKHSQRFLFVATAAYLVLGLGSGLAYRELTKHAGLADGQPLQLGVLHTHLLTLGFVVGLVVLVLDRVFALGRSKLFPVFFGVYNAGVILSAAMMAVHGGIVLSGGTPTAATAGIAGMGHILLSIGLGVLVVIVGQAVWTRRPQGQLE